MGYMENKFTNNFQVDRHTGMMKVILNRQLKWHGGFTVYMCLLKVAVR